MMSILFYSIFMGLLTYVVIDVLGNLSFFSDRDPPRIESDSDSGEALLLTSDEMTLEEFDDLLMSLPESEEMRSLNVDVPMEEMKEQFVEHWIEVLISRTQRGKQGWKSLKGETVDNQYRFNRHVATVNLEPGRRQSKSNTFRVEIAYLRGSSATPSRRVWIEGGGMKLSQNVKGEDVEELFDLAEEKAANGLSILEMQKVVSRLKG